MISKLKRFMLNTVGTIITIISIGIIYLILYKQGIIKELDQTFWIEFGIVCFLMVEMRIFWYKDTELRIRNSNDYIDKQRIVEDAINETVQETDDFDKYIDIENDINYNIFIKNKTDKVTAKNYQLKFRDKLQNGFIIFTNIFRKNKKLKLSRAQFFEAFKIRVEQKACKIHKLSSSGILTMSQQPLLDDRNYTAKHKFLYLLFGTITSVLVIALAALIGFNNKLTDEETLTKFTIYIGAMFFAIGQTVIAATTSIKIGEYNYFRRIIKILDRYNSYKNRHKEDSTNANTSNKTSSDEDFTG